MAYTKRLKYQTLQKIASSTITGTYQTLGTLTHPGAIIKVLNNSTQDVTISVDGTNDHDYAPTSSFFLYDCVTNAPTVNEGVFVPSGTVYSVKGTAGTGNIYLVVQYVAEV